ncbi:MAG: hypothetical protein KAR51_02210 [Candidatus Aenigmarchaeota archaeon]|nr:hypothetical protein [Candidatus Aenigmarchaeota archaeon]
MARLTYANVIKEFELDFTSKELKSLVRRDGSNLEELYTALNKVDGFADVLNDSRPKKAPRLTYAGVIEELGLEELTENDLKSLVRKNSMTLQEMYTLMKEDPYFQRQLDIYKIQRDSKVGVADKAIVALLGPNTPLPEDTTIPTTLTQDEIEKRKSQPYDGIIPQIMTGEQKKAYNTMLKGSSEQGTGAIQDLQDFIATGNTSNLAGYGTDTDAIPEAQKDTVRMEDIDTVLKNIENAYLTSPDYKRKIKAIEADLNDKLNENDLILTKRYGCLIHSLANILTAYDRDGVDMAVTDFVESNMENGFDVSLKHQEMLDYLIELKHADIERYERKATEYDDAAEQISSEHNQSPPYNPDLYDLKSQIVKDMGISPDKSIIAPTYNRPDLKAIRALGEKAKEARNNN